MIRLEILELKLLVMNYMEPVKLCGIKLDNNVNLILSGWMMLFAYKLWKNYKIVLMESLDHIIAEVLNVLELYVLDLDLNLLLKEIILNCVLMMEASMLG